MRYLLPYLMLICIGLCSTTNSLNAQSPTKVPYIGISPSFQINDFGQKNISVPGFIRFGNFYISVGPKLFVGDPYDNQIFLRYSLTFSRFDQRIGFFLSAEHILLSQRRLEITLELNYKRTEINLRRTYGQTDRLVGYLRLNEVGIGVVGKYEAFEEIYIAFSLGSELREQSVWTVMSSGGSGGLGKTDFIGYVRFGLFLPFAYKRKNHL